MTVDAAPKADTICTSCGASFVPGSGPGQHKRLKCYTCSPEGSNGGTARAAKSKRAAPKSGAAVKVDIRAKVTESVQGIGAVIAIAGQGISQSDQARGAQITFDGVTIANGAAALGDAVGDLADENPVIRKALERMFRVSTYGKLVMAVGAIAVPIAANHGLFPAGIAEALGSFGAAPAPAPASANGAGHYDPVSPVDMSWPPEPSL
jgi:hypothetical protein